MKKLFASGRAAFLHPPDLFCPPKPKCEPPENVRKKKNPPKAGPVATGNVRLPQLARPALQYLMPQLIVTRRTLISANKMHVLINRMRNTFLLARRAIVRVERYRFHNRRHTFAPPLLDSAEHLGHGGTPQAVA